MAAGFLMELIPAVTFSFYVIADVIKNESSGILI